MNKSIEKDGLLSDTFIGTENGVVHERKIDHKPIIEHNKKLYTQNDGYSADKGLKRVASIPTLVLEIWAKEYNKDQNNGNWFALPKDILELHQEDFNGINKLHNT